MVAPHRLRRLIERDVKRMLIEEAKRHGVDPRAIIEWLRDEHGIQVGGRPDWSKVEKVVVSSDEVTSYELASFLQELGIEVPEEKWIEVLRRYGVRV
jgi:hypothetical protein